MCTIVGMEAGKKRLAGDTAREATSDEIKQLRASYSTETCHLVERSDAGFCFARFS